MKPSSGRNIRRLLIIECDVERLNKIDAALGVEIADLLETPRLASQITLIKVGKKADLQNRVIQLAEQGVVFENIWITAHSSETGLRLASDYWSSWTDLARLLACFKPQAILLAACKAGRCGPAEKLFGVIRSLKTLYGSPLLMSVSQMKILRCVIAGLLLGIKIRTETNLLLRIGAFVATGGFLFRYTRSDFNKKTGKTRHDWNTIPNILEMLSRV